MSYESLLIKSGTILRATTVTTSASGEETKTYTPVTTGVPCDVQVTSGGEVQYPFGTMVESNAKAFFLPGVDIREDDRLLVDGLTYEVLFVENVRGHHLEAYLHRGLRRA